VKYLRLYARLLFFAAYTAVIVAEIWLRNVVQGADVRRSMRIRRRWAKHLLYGVGVRSQFTGYIPDFPCILIGNHRSYMDPILMLQHVDAYPVAKAELANWPLLGKGSALAGIIFLKRDNVRSGALALEQIKQIVDKGFPVIIFPEGTTSDLPGSLPFKRGVFQLAAKNNYPIVPVAVVFEQTADYWVGNVTFLGHASQRFREKNIHVSLHYGPVQQGDSAEVLLDHTKTWIDQVLIGKAHLPGKS
jgi:1-acyl-sn-glycerol-3-phosphate acyltransferase